MSEPRPTEAVARRIRRIEDGLLRFPQLRHGELERATLAERMEHFRCPGVSIAVIHDDRVEWARGYGVRHAGEASPVTTETLFQAGSISKPVAATVALRLVEEGSLSLDADVNDVLTSWTVPANGSWQPRITLRQLLSHSAGLTVHGFPGYPRDEQVPTVVQVLNGEYPANTDPIRVDTVPGVQFRYSGGGTTVVQQMLVDLLGKPFPQIAREQVLDPLGMTNSTYEQPLPEHRWGAAASGHLGRDLQKSKAVDGRWNIYPEMAAAGLWTTPSDLARFALEIRRARAGRPGAILSAAMVEQMLTPQVEEQIGLGFFLSGTGENRRFGHGGADHGFIATLTAYVERGFGAVVMTNAYSRGLCEEIVRAIAVEYDWPEYLATKQAARVDPGLYEAYVGEYEGKPGIRFAISREGESLRFRPPGQAPVELLAESETRFFAKVINAEITFARGDEGKASALILHQNGQEVPATRVE